MRNDLNLSAASNFLLAVLCNTDEFDKAIRARLNNYFQIPTDVIEILDFYQADPHRKSAEGAFPAWIRKLVTKKFAEFTVDDFGKYLNDRAIKKKYKKKKMKLLGIKKKPKVKLAPGTTTVKKVKPRAKTEKVPGLRLPITWFYLVKKFHITEPQTNVMAVLGKRFPKTEEELKQSGLKGQFFPSLANKRLQFPKRPKFRNYDEPKRVMQLSKMLEQFPFVNSLITLGELIRTQVKEQERVTKLQNTRQFQNLLSLKNYVPKSPQLKHTAITRLIADWREVLENPLPFISAQPLDDNFFEWHCNLRGLNDAFREISFHFILTFSSTYPNTPPEIIMCTHLLHPNVFQRSRGTKSTASFICLDMLNPPAKSSRISEKVDNIMVSGGWSPAYSVLSILMQLQTFLQIDYSEHKELFANKSLGMNECIRRARTYCCPVCPHKMNHPHPAYRTKPMKKKQSKVVVQVPILDQPQQKDEITQTKEYAWKDKADLIIEENRTKICNFIINGHTFAPENNAVQPVDEEPEDLKVLTLSVDEENEVSLDAQALENMGLFSVMPYEVLLSMAQLLPPSAIGALGRTCRELRRIVNDGWLWKHIFSFYYAKKDISVASMDDWKHAFALEVNEIPRELTCFYTKQSFKQDVLGYPLFYTINPRTRLVDYITSPLELLSATAFYQHKIRRSVWREQFTDWLPIYITEEHFERGLPYMKAVFIKLCPQYKDCTFKPEMAVDVLCKLMNTMSVLIADKGLHASTKALEGYCAFHRLLIAFIQRYPELNDYIIGIIDRFVATEEGRHKNVVPALGNFLPLLAVQEKYQWHQVAKAFLFEQFDRNVLWICNRFPELLQIEAAAKVNDQVRIDKSFQATTVSMRLLMFQIFFLTRIGRPRDLSIKQIAANYDVFYGMPPRASKMKFLQHAKRLFQVEQITDVLYNIGARGKELTEARLARWLRDCVANSARKGYHTDKTGFGKMGRNVSVILQQNESYMIDPKRIKNLRFEITYGWDGPRVWLDAGWILTSGNRAYASSLINNEEDYDYRWRYDEELAFLQHGTQTYDHEHIGESSFQVYLNTMKDNVDSIFFTMWSSPYYHINGMVYNTLSGAKDIKVTVIDETDPNKPQALCRVSLKPRKKKPHTDGAVFCRLTRVNRDKWVLKNLVEEVSCNDNPERVHRVLYDHVNEVIAKEHRVKGK
jgi:ubiquitin-protein ligase